MKKMAPALRFVHISVHFFRLNFDETLLDLGVWVDIH